MKTTINFKRINNDINGNPRYVCHFSNLLEDNFYKSDLPSNMTGKQWIDIVTYRYNIALKRAKQIGGKKFHNKQYGGGIVFQSYNIQQTEENILNLLNN